MTGAEMPGGPLYSPSDNQIYSLATNPNMQGTPQGQQAQAILARKQQEKTQLTGTEAYARIGAENSPQAIQGAVAKKQALDAATDAGEQVYATNQQGQRALMTKGDAIAAGFGYQKVGAKQVQEDTQLNNRLADVRQKISQYEQSFQQPLDSHGWCSGRSSEMAMQLNLDTLPAPIDPESYAGNALKAFKQNLVVAGQGMPILPGVKTPEQIEQQINTR